MSDTFECIKFLVKGGFVRLSEHGYDELVADGIRSRDIIEGIGNGRAVEDYPKGPCVLVLQEDRNGNPIHVLWGIPKGHSNPAVVVTAYRPTLDLWQDGFMKRRT